MTPISAEKLSLRAIMAIVFGLLFAWSLFAYLTIRVDSDILAEAIQVQRWLEQPGLVLSYPGQLYGGVLEYPIIGLVESIVPGEVYALTALRVLYLPIVGVLAVYVTHLLFPRWKLWPFIPAVALGPAVLHGMMAIKDLYPFSWLVAMIGTAIAFRSLERGCGGVWLAVGGLLSGLAIYQHPTAALLVLPLAVAAGVCWSVRWKQLFTWGAGFAIGLVPLLVARFGQPDAYVPYVPQRRGVPDVLGAFGISIDGWPQAIVPNGWGVQYTNLNSLEFPGWLQLAINAALLGFVVLCFVIAIRAAASEQFRRDASPRTVLAMMWVTVAVVVIAIVVVVPPVFFYGSALAVPVWITLVSGFNAVWTRAGTWASTAVLFLAGATSLGMVLALNPALPGAVGFKRAQAAEVRQVAEAIQDAGITVVLGGYWETLPIAYASEGALAPVTVPVSRFPTPDIEGESVLVAVPTGYTALPPGLERWTNAEAAVGLVDARCTRLSEDIPGIPVPIRAYECPISALTP